MGGPAVRVFCGALLHRAGAVRAVRLAQLCARVVSVCSIRQNTLARRQCRGEGSRIFVLCGRSKGVLHSLWEYVHRASTSLPRIFFFSSQRASGAPLCSACGWSRCISFKDSVSTSLRCPVLFSAIVVAPLGQRGSVPRTQKSTLLPSDSLTRNKKKSRNTRDKWT